MCLCACAGLLANKKTMCPRTSFVVCFAVCCFLLFEKKQKQSKFAKFVRLILLSGHFVDLSKSRRFKGRIYYLFVCSVNLAKEHMMLLLANILPQFAKRLSLYVRWKPYVCVCLSLYLCALIVFLY